MYSQIQAMENDFLAQVEGDPILEGRHWLVPLQSSILGAWADQCDVSGLAIPKQPQERELSMVSRVNADLFL